MELIKIEYFGQEGYRGFLAQNPGSFNCGKSVHEINQGLWNRTDCQILISVESGLNLPIFKPNNNYAVLYS